MSQSTKILSEDEALPQPMLARPASPLIKEHGGATVAPSTATHPFTWPRVLGGLAAVLLVGGAGASYGIYSGWKNSEKIAPGVVLQGVPVGGKTRLQARREIEKRFARPFLTIEAPQRDYKLALKQLGGQPRINDAINNAYFYRRSGNVLANVWNTVRGNDTEKRLAIPVKWDKKAMRRTMWTVNKSYTKPPKDARLAFVNGTMDVVPEQVGSVINVGATLRDLQKSYFVGKESIQATTRETQPKVLAASLEGENVKLGEYRTYFDSGLWGRTRNIEIAADVIDGRVLMPGEKFSFNDSTGERTWDKGYRMAHIFERKPGKSESEVVDGLAGGVCQVSSTLYNAVRKSNKKTDRGLAIVERNSHSLPVTYVPMGLDATVAYPHKDFKFRNTLPYPVYLRAYTSGSRLYISVWGRVPRGSANLYASNTAGDGTS